MKRLLLTAATLIVLTAGVQAGQCPGLIQKDQAAGIQMRSLTHSTSSVSPSGA